MDVSYDCALALMRALSEKDMNAFLRLLYDEFHFPCVALDAAHRTIAIAPEEHLTGDVYWDAATQLRATSTQLLTHVYDYSYTEEIVQGSRCGRIVELTWGDIKYPHMASAIIDDGDIIGYTNLLFVGPEAVHDDALAIAGILRDGICTIMKSQKQSGRAQAQQLKAEFAAKLFSHRFSTEKEISGWARSCGITLSESYAVLCVGATPEVQQFDAGYFNSLMRALYPSCIYETRSGENYLFLYGVRSRAHLDTIIQEFSQRIMSSYTLGVSSLFQDITGIDIYIEQASKAFDYGKSTQAACRIFRYDACQMPIFKSTLKSAEHPIREPQILQQLAAYDAENGTCYAQTLIRYLTNFGDRQKTTAQLDIHRNTLKYRLDKIEELCGVNLEDTDLLRKLFLSYYMCTS